MLLKRTLAVSECKMTTGIKASTTTCHPLPSRSPRQRVTSDLHDVGVVDLSLPDGRSVVALLKRRGVVVGVLQVDRDSAVGRPQAAVPQHHQLCSPALLIVQDLLTHRYVTW